jgi:uncharacterized membrane protein YgaE (UPF0421/DUF939 family)
MTADWRYSIMKNKANSRRLARIAFFTALAAQTIPCCSVISNIVTPAYYTGPFIAEFRVLILILGLLSALLGALALVGRTDSKVKAVAAIVLGLAAVIWHIVLCGTDTLHEPPFCTMVWFIRYP